MTEWSSKGFLILLYKHLFFSSKWHLGGLASMENTPTGCGGDLSAVLRTSQNNPKSRSGICFSSNGRIWTQTVAKTSTSQSSA